MRMKMFCDTQQIDVVTMCLSAEGLRYLFGGTEENQYFQF
jgi:hypothetical protein